MSCILIIMGRDLDVDSFITKTGLKPYKRNYRGQPSPNTRFNGGKLKHSLIAIEASKAEFSNLNKQIKDTVAYLTKNKAKLKHIATTKGVQSAKLDFGIDLTIDNVNNLTQVIQLPTKLLKLTGDLGLEIELSLYPIDLEKTLEKKLFK